MKPTAHFLLALLGALTLSAQTPPSPVTRAQSSTPNISPPPDTTLPTKLPVPGQAYPVLQVTVEHPILFITEANPTPKTRITVQPLRFPPGAQLTAKWSQVQDAISPLAAKLEICPVTFSPTTSALPFVDASFPGPGVYEVRLVVHDNTSNLTATQNTWINVWDSHSHIMVDGKADPLCPAPGINPPNVRTLSPDPGPFHHPRLYTTDADWKEVSDRCAKGVIASFAVEKLQQEVADSIDSSSSEFGKLTSKLETYANANYAGSAPDLTMGVPQGVDPKKGDKNWDAAHDNLARYYDHLRSACFLAWLGQNPLVPSLQVNPDKQKHFRRLAKVLAAVTHVQLAGSYDVATGTFHQDYPLYLRGLDTIGYNFDNYSSVALAYDFIASWMTPKEQQETRNLLFAQSAGRTTGARSVFFASGVHNRVYRGQEQNGDFMNIEEEKVLASLAIAGEEATVPEKLRDTFLNPPKPKDYDKPDDYFPNDWANYTYVDGPRQQPGARPYPDACSWPFARKVEVDNLRRAQWWNDDWYVTPWGFQLNHEAYYGFSAYGLWPTTVAYARHGAENQYVASNYYITINHLLWNCYAGEGYNKTNEFVPNRYMYDHHDGGGDYRQNHIVLMKYMYPDDPAVDYYYSGDAAPGGDPQNPRPGIGFNPFIDALFALDPGVNGQPSIDLAVMAKQKGLPLTKVDPQKGVVVARSAWTDDAMELYFDEAWAQTGHMHAEKGNFSFFALGRPWSISPGYHIVQSGYQSEVLIQDPRFASDKNNQGYVGQGPNIAIEDNPDFDKAYGNCFPTPPGHLYPVTESPDKTFLVMAGENTVPYSYSFGRNAGPTGLHRTQFMYPGIFEDLIQRLPNNKELMNDDLKLTPDYNPVKYAYRTILFVRGNHPYALIMDDINKDDKPQNYRWQMNCTSMFGPPDGRMADASGKGLTSDLAIMPNATATEATLYHSPIDDAPSEEPNRKGLARLLVRDLSEAPLDKATLPIEVNQQPLGQDPTGIHRAYIYKNNVADPQFKVILFPYRTGEKLPVTRWSPDHSTLSIDLPDHQTDVITFDRSNPDHRTRIKSTLRQPL